MNGSKVLKYISAVLLVVLLITVSSTYKGLLGIYSSTYYNSSVDLSIRKYIMGTDYDFDLPSGWTYNEEKFEGGEILYHGDFMSSDKNIRGFAEVWKIETPLLNFLQESKKSSEGSVAYKEYKLEKAKIGIYNGYVLEYSIRGNNGKYYKAFEYFIPSKDKAFFRISFFVPEDIYSTKINMVIKSIVNTIQMKNHFD